MGLWDPILVPPFWDCGFPCWAYCWKRNVTHAVSPKWIPLKAPNPKLDCETVPCIATSREWFWKREHGWKVVTPLIGTHLHRDRASKASNTRYPIRSQQERKSWRTEEELNFQRNVVVRKYFSPTGLLNTQFRLIYRVHCPVFYKLLTKLRAISVSYWTSLLDALRDDETKRENKLLMCLRFWLKAWV